jgi:hypothetical protein
MQAISPVPSPAPVSPQSLSYNQPPAVLLIGGPGSGKSFSLATVLKYGLRLVIAGTEPRFHESVLDAATKMGLDKSRIFLKYIPPVKVNLSTFMKNAQLANQLSFEALTQMKGSFDKPEYQQYYELLRTLSNFKDDITGAELGAIDTWGPDTCFTLDSLSGLNIMVRDYVTGAKPVLAPGEWQIMMEQEERLINLIASNTKCMFVLTAHVEREMNEVTGGTINTAGALGKRLAPKLPRFFSEVIHTHRVGSKYLWSTMTEMYDLKQRSLPLSDKLEPDFGPIIAAWRARNG